MNWKVDFLLRVEGKGVVVKMVSWSSGVWRLEAHMLVCGASPVPLARKVSWLSRFYSFP